MNNLYKEALPYYLTESYIMESNRLLGLSEESLEAILSNQRTVVEDESLITQAVELKELLFVPRKILEDVGAINWQIPEHAPLMPLIVLLAGIKQLQQFYQAHQISSDILSDTLGDISRNLMEARIRNGAYRIEPYIYDWLVKHMTNKLFHLGRLQFEIRCNKKDYPLLRKGDYVLNTHIPSGSRLRHEEAVASYRMAVDLFNRLTPEITYRGFICESWMLSPQLREMLGEESNLIKFLKDYELYWREESDSFYPYVFINKPENLQDLSEKTSLQKAIKEHLLKGEKMEDGHGFLAIEKVIV